MGRGVAPDSPWHGKGRSPASQVLPSLAVSRNDGPTEVAGACKGERGSLLRPEGGWMRGIREVRGAAMTYGDCFHLTIWGEMKGIDAVPGAGRACGHSFHR